MQIAHEAPLEIMDVIQSQTDYDYCLVHLLEESPRYLDFFTEAKTKGRKIIMDCSLFELGKAFDDEKYYNWLLKIQPDEYIVPDVWQDCDQNIISFQNFTQKFNLSALSGKKIGVLQGNSYEEFEKSCEFMLKNADKVAISFGYDFYTNSQVSESEDSITPVLTNAQKLSEGRKNLFKHLYDKGLFMEEKRMHLLGCGTPTELEYYVRFGFDFVESVDTSHPVMSGFYKKSYAEDPANLIDKVSQKMVDIFNETVTADQLEIIEANIYLFKEICGRR
jgi:hypothetical protein